MKKYESKQVEGKVRKENKDMTRNLCFHDWLIVRELKVLDDVYDDALRQFDYKILDLYGIENSDERQEKYDKILEERETLRAIYIQRRNELKAGFTDRQDREVSEKEVNKKGRYPWGPKKQAVEETANGIRHGGICYVDTDEIKALSKSSLNGRFGCIDESAEFKDDPIVEAVLDEENMSKKPDVMIINNGSNVTTKGLRGLVHTVDEVGPVPALTPEYLDSVLHEYNKEDE